MSGRCSSPELTAGDVVIMDNSSSRKGPQVRTMIEAAGASLLDLPPYSPDFNPIENALAKLKALLRKAATRSVPTLWAAIGQLIDTFTLNECATFFRASATMQPESNPLSSSTADDRAPSRAAVRRPRAA